MAFRIGEYIIGGSLDNTRRHRVSGWIAFGERCGIHLELVGDLAGDLQGRRIEFDVPGREPGPDDVVEPLIKDLSRHQIGAAGDMLFRIARVPEGPIDEFYLRCKRGDPPPVHEHPCLYLEWFGQQGRVVAEIVDPVLSDVVAEETQPSDAVPEPLPDPSDVGLGVTGVSIDENGYAETFKIDTSDEEDDDPYGLFPADIEQQLNVTEDVPYDDFPSAEPPQPRDWADVIPGIDPETKALYEQWDEIYGGRKDELLSAMLDPPLQLPPPDEVQDEATARAYVLQIAASLARLSVAFDLCKHFDMVRAYRWLVEEILVEGHVHPNQLAHEIVTHYSSWEFCPACDAEFDAEYEREQREGG